MIEWGATGGVKVKRAKKHIHDLIGEIAIFLKRDPYFFETETDEQTRRVRYRIRVREGPPLHLGAIAGDALHNLRSALDVLWRGVWYPDGGGEDDRRCGFPILKSADELERRHPINRFVKGGRKAAVKIAHEVKAYKGGNDLLWMLEEGNALDKHRLLIPVFARLFKLKFPPESVIVEGRRLRVSASVDLEGKLGPVKDGAVVYEHPIDFPMQVDMNFKPTLDIAFGEVGPLKGKPMVGLIHQMADEVEGVVKAFHLAGVIR